MLQDLTYYTDVLGIVGDILRVRAKDVGFGDLAVVALLSLYLFPDYAFREVHFHHRNDHSIQFPEVFWSWGCCFCAGFSAAQ